MIREILLQLTEYIGENCEKETIVNAIKMSTAILIID